ncbi:glucan endo-1,3-beta-glucosidase 5-like isoform X2 [Carica papaya]|uniref:glucan endo-1,3-beta-glucosidase 5-like isoform X2 n=1 Tax=Carica papaya TaxID=3649 RepID=UPI000B8CD339|nr:glucan endo-1,3-beta-glucosidase 5-like isoform X2 [Carica papaya]
MAAFFGFKAPFFCLMILLVLVSVQVSESAIGVNWGTVSFLKLNPSTVLDLLKQNKIQKVKIFDADPTVLEALVGSGIEVMIGIPNEMLAPLSSSTVAADLWVRQNVSRYLVKGGVDIRISQTIAHQFMVHYLP